VNLYEIRFVHYAPRDDEEGIFNYLVANSDEDVYEWLKSDPELKDGRHIFTGYKFKEEDDEVFEVYNDNYRVIGTETFKERMLRLKGDMLDEEAELNDLYYGKTLWGWRLVKENITQQEIDTLLSLGICLETKQD